MTARSCTLTEVYKGRSFVNHKSYLLQSYVLNLAIPTAFGLMIRLK